MFFLALCLVFSLVLYVPQWFFAGRRDRRTALRHGLAAGFVFTGVDHFVHTQERYVPMIPDFLAGAATALVYVTGVAEVAGAVGLVVPLAVYRRLGLPNLRWWAGVGLTVLLAVMVAANINVAMQGSAVEGLDAGPVYAWVRPLLQPVIMAWALYAGEVWPRRRMGHETPPPPASRPRDLRTSHVGVVLLAAGGLLASIA